MKEIIAKRLKRLRGNQSAIKVASDLGISVSALRMYECAQRVPKDDIKARIARYYGVSIEQLFFDREEHETLS